jgi:hypothetical protein
LRPLHGSVTFCHQKSSTNRNSAPGRNPARNSNQTRVSDAENMAGVAIGFSGDLGAQRYHV